MFLTQVNYMWRDLGHGNGRRAALLVLAPWLLFVVLALPTALAMPALAWHAELAGTGTSVGPELHLSDNYKMTITITGRAGCVYAANVGPIGFSPDPFPSYATVDEQRVVATEIGSIPDGMYRIAMTATGCGAWTVALDRS